MIKFKDVMIKYGEFTAVSNLDFEVREGEFFTFLGPSGCGKTTTLRALVGLTSPSSGNIFLNGKDITHLPTEKRDIKMVFQSYALFPTMTVFENIAFGPKVKKVSKKETEQKVYDIAAKVDLKQEQLNKKVSELSGGQQQRVAIARALVNQPNILVMDEPLSNLDAKLRSQLRKELKRLQKDFGITTIYVTHDQEEALTLSDRIAVFNKGNIEQIGTPEEIYEQSASAFVCNFIGESNNLYELLERYPDKFDQIDVENYQTFFNRIEKVKVFPIETQTKLQNNEVKFEGTIIDSEYFGIYTKYLIKIDGITLSAILKEKLSLNVKEETKVQVIINQQDILQYK
jgi:iron(III) transport system ATP-binding protein